MRSLASMVDYLRDEGVLGAEDPGPPLTPLDELIAKYTSWLGGDRGLAPATVLRYENLARKFLKSRSTPADELGLTNLAGTDVAAFLHGECVRLSVGAAKGRVAELRSLLRFLYLHGHGALSGGCGAAGGGMARHWAASCSGAAPGGEAADKL